MFLYCDLAYMPRGVRILRPLIQEANGDVQLDGVAFSRVD